MTRETLLRYLVRTGASVELRATDIGSRAASGAQIVDGDRHSRSFRLTEAAQRRARCPQGEPSAMLPAVSAALAERSPEGHWDASERSMQSTLRPHSLHVMNPFATRLVDALA